jgi:chemotaxis protein CheX
MILWFACPLLMILNSWKHSSIMTVKAQGRLLDVSEKRQKLIQPFANCTKDVFSMMLNWETDLIGIFSNEAFMSRYDCSGLIGVSGALRGSIVVSVDQDVAFAAAESFLGEKPSTINAEVIDMVGELTNMIAGAGKDRIGIPGIMLGLPTVITGRGHTVTFDHGAHVEILQFSSPHGPFTVEIGVRGL